MAFWRLYYHLVWATKQRVPLITADFEDQLYSFLVHKAGELGAYIFQVNGMPDHIHTILTIPPKLSVSEVVKHLKGGSSHFINSRGFIDSKFRWQRGYGVLSLGEKQRSAAEEYVRNQKQHHLHSTTNSWLERVADYDEGPYINDNVLREPPVTYLENDDFPF